MRYLDLVVQHPYPLDPQNTSEGFENSYNHGTMGPGSFLSCLLLFISPVQPKEHTHGDEEPEV